MISAKHMMVCYKNYVHDCVDYIVYSLLEQVVK